MNKHTDSCRLSKIEDERCVVCLRTRAEHECGCMATTTLHPTGDHSYEARVEVAA